MQGSTAERKLDIGFVSDSNAGIDSTVAAPIMFVRLRLDKELGVGYIYYTGYSGNESILWYHNIAIEREEWVEDEGNGGG